MVEKNKHIIIIKKVIKKKPAAHGGSWKIAYADFVTAMMAFFMLLWLLSLLNKYQLEGISKYFKKPLKEVFVGNKNPEQYKNQIKHDVVSMQEDIGGSVNSELLTQDNEESAKEKKHTSPETKLKEAEKLLKDKEKKELMALKHKMELAFNTDAVTKGFKDHLDFSIVHDGLKVSLHDSENKQMFSLGKADFQNYAKDIIKWLGKEFNQLPKKIIIIGHTDTHQYNEKANYTNWELSTDRANTVRHLLVMQGMNPEKIIRVEGAAAVSLYDKKDGNNLLNRRVEIIVLTNEAAKHIIDQ